MAAVVRLLRDSELEEADALLQAAFERTESFAPIIRLQRAIEPDAFWVAQDRRRIVGTVAAVDYRPVAYIGLMTVHPTRQRLGIGRILMGHVLDWARARGCPIAVLDATDKGAGLYQTIGFGDDAAAYAFELELSTPAVVPRAGRQVQVASADDLAEIAAFDAPLFGADRQKLFRALWGENRDRCLIARDEASNLAGYVFARDRILGPWAAVSSDVAERLLVAGLSLPFEQPAQVLVPRSNHLSVELLRRRGFTERRRLRHMRRGGNSPPGQPSHLYGQASFAHG